MHGNTWGKYHTPIGDWVYSFTIIKDFNIFHITANKGREFGGGGGGVNQNRQAHFTIIKWK